MKKTISLICAATLTVGVITLVTTREATAANKATATPTVITPAEVNAAQQAWCNALVAIGKAESNAGGAKALATKVLSEAYSYDSGKVFFKPTLTFGDQTFRPTKDSALAYFVGGNPAFADDKGFALKPWVKARFDNLGEGDAGIQIHGDIAITMGNVWVTGADGSEVKVDKTFVFKKGSDNKLRLILHHSSLPYTPPAKVAAGK